MNTKNLNSVTAMGGNFYKIGAIAASLFLLLSALLPYCKVKNSMVAKALGYSSFSLAKAGDDSRGVIIVLIMTGLMLLFLFLDKKIISLIVGILNLLLYISSMMLFNARLAEAKKQLHGVMSVNDLISKGAGYYLLRIACVIFTAALLLYFFQKKEVKKI